MWISSDNNTEEEDNIYGYYPDIIYSNLLESLSFSVCKIWQKRQLHINTNFVVTGWMLCVIPHIRKDAKHNFDSYHGKQVKKIIKNIFHGASEEEMAVTQDKFCTDYTEFDNNIGSFDADEFN